MVWKKLPQERKNTKNCKHSYTHMYVRTCTPPTPWCMHIYTHIHPCMETRMQDMEMPPPHSHTHIIYIHDIRIQNRDAHTDSITNAHMYITHLRAHRHTCTRTHTHTHIRTWTLHGPLTCCFPQGHAGLKLRGGLCLCRVRSVRWWRNCSDGEQYRVWWCELVQHKSGVCVCVCLIQQAVSTCLQEKYWNTTCNNNMHGGFPRSHCALKKYCTYRHVCHGAYKLYNTSCFPYTL